MFETAQTLGDVNTDGTPGRSDPPRPAKIPVVLQVLPRLETGGAERGTVDVAAALVEAGWKAVVASGGGPMVRELERAGATHVELPVYSKNPLTMWTNVRRLEKVIRAHKVDIVHARSRAPAWSAQAAAKRTGARFMTTFHGNYPIPNRFKRKYNSVMAKGDLVIAISDYIADQVIRTYAADPERVRVIHRGIDLSLFSPNAVSAERIIQLATDWRLPDGAPVIMLPARLSRWKGHSVLIDALVKLGRRDVRCLMVGAEQGREGYRQWLDEYIKRAGVEPIVHIVGHCRDMPAAYMLADVVVSASIEAEAFGRVAVEAQAMGRPVVAADHGGAHETVVHGETGWLVKPGDSTALAEMLAMALSLTPEDRDLLARQARSHVYGRFGRETMCERTLAVYGELLPTGA
jgi:glycosyltransferase involved in cell wall biosynthesis